MRRHVQGIGLGAMMLVALAAVAERPSRPVPAYHVEVVDENGNLLGEYLSADDHDSTPAAVLGLLKTRDGHAAQLRFTIDREEGIVTRRFLDLHSGWWIELRHDFGIRNLGGPEDFADPMQWMVAIQERQIRERPVATYTLATSDGAHAAWTKAWQAAEAEVEAARTDALASLAADLAKREFPGSTLAELKLLATIAESEERDELSAFADLIEHLLLVVRAVRGTGIEAEKGQVEVSFAGERPEDVNRLMKTLDPDRE